MSLALSNAIVSVRDAGIIFIASAGNNTVNLDVTPHYPACYNIDNIVSVAYTTHNDTLGGFSNYGVTNVDLAAPGDQIYSTIHFSDSSYYPPGGLGINIAGTSFAAAYVSGACALLAGKCRTGGRLNLRKALRTIRVATIPATNSGPFQLRVSGGLNRTCAVEATTNLISWSPVFTNTASTNGTFDFTDDQSTNLPQRFFRAAAAP